MANPGVAAGWYPDPRDTAHLRYWDGIGWTEHAMQNPHINAALNPEYHQATIPTEQAPIPQQAVTPQQAFAPQANASSPTTAQKLGRGAKAAASGTFSVMEWIANAFDWIVTKFWGLVLTVGGGAMVFTGANVGVGLACAALGVVVLIFV